MTSDQTDKLVAALDKISKRLTVISIAQEVQAEMQLFQEENEPTLKKRGRPKKNQINAE